jgi:hypothetical protein
LRARPEAKFTLKILETSQGISIVCEGDLISECDMQEFTDLAQQIANDYSVTVYYLVVKSGNNL